jgi:hypothetical protein
VHQMIPVPQKFCHDDAMRLVDFECSRKMSLQAQSSLGRCQEEQLLVSSKLV